MKERNKRNKKILGIINVVVIVYIFTLVVGYSFFRESLKISGNVSTDQPVDCPFEAQEVGSYYSLVGGNSSLSFYDVNTSQLEQLSQIDISAININSGIPNAFIFYPLGFYDKTIDTLSFVILRAWLYTTNMVGIKPVPMYYVLLNTSARSIDEFKIKVDYDNQVSSSHEPPLELFDIRHATVKSVDEVIDMAAQDFDDQDSLPGWNSMQSVFENSSMDRVSYLDSDYYYYDQFQEGAEIEFSTDPVGPGEYLVLGLNLPQRKNTSPEEVEANWKNYYMAFKFWPSTFSEKSAFHVRIKYEDDYSESGPVHEFGNQIANTYGNGTNSLDAWHDFFANPSLVTPPWW